MSISGTVKKELGTNHYGNSYEVKTDTVNGLKEKQKIILYTNQTLETGDTVSGDAKLSYLLKNGDSYLSRLRSGGYIFSAKDISMLCMPDESFNIRRSTHRFNVRMTNMFVNRLGEERGGFAAALILGNRTHLNTAIRTDFSIIGGAHILAISGMHLTIISALIGYLFFFLPYHFKTSLQICVVVFYMFITGFPASVTRSGIMLLMMYIFNMFRREPDGFTDLSLAAMIIIFADPNSLFDIGLQLSVASVFAIYLFSNTMPDIFEKTIDKQKPFIIRFLKSIVASVELSCVVVVFILPFEYLYFGSFSIFAPITNLTVSLLATVLLAVLPLLLIFSGSYAVFGLLMYPAYYLCGITIDIAHELSKIRHIVYSLDFNGALFLCFTAMFGVIVFCLAKSRRLGRLFFVLFVSALMLGAYMPIISSYSSSYIDVSGDKYSNNSAVAIFSEGKLSVITSGESEAGMISSSLGQAGKFGAVEIENLIFTSITADEIMDLPEIIASMRVRYLYIPEMTPESYISALDYASGDITEVRVLKSTKNTIGSLEYTYSSADRYDVTVRHKTLTYLSSDGFNSLSKRETPKSDILLVGTEKTVKNPIVSDEYDGIILSLGYGQIICGKNSTNIVVADRSIDFLADDEKIYRVYENFHD